MNYYLSVDIGASGGKMVLGWLEDGKIKTEEIHRFTNGAERKNRKLCWNLPDIMDAIICGMKKCKAAGKVPFSMGVDTWAVDYVLLDQTSHVLGSTYCYRDERTETIPKRAENIMSQAELYQHTGIQKQRFNTIYQLLALKEQEPEILSRADKLLMIPDYLHYLLTGIASAEYTNATTTQLVNIETGTWDRELIQVLGFPEHIFLPIRDAGTVLGTLTKEISQKVGFSCNVVLPPTHDTASAVLAVPGRDPFLYISSGTWSLMGTELKTADCSDESRNQNFTNEGGYAHRFRYLKNIMGLWMIQSIRREIAQEVSFETLCELASKEKIESIVDCNEERFLAPKSMTDEINVACREKNMQIPRTAAEYASVVYRSLAVCYAKTAKEIEILRGVQYPEIYIVGGGSNAGWLNQLTADYSGKIVKAGPVEASAIGNLVAQMLSAGEWPDVKMARKSIADSFPIRTYLPGKAEIF